MFEKLPEGILKHLPHFRFPPALRAGPAPPGQGGCLARGDSHGRGCEVAARWVCLAFLGAREASLLARADWPLTYRLQRNVHVLRSMPVFIGLFVFADWVATSCSDIPGKVPRRHVRRPCSSLRLRGCFSCWWLPCVQRPCVRGAPGCVSAFAAFVFGRNRNTHIRAPGAASCVHTFGA